MTAATRQFVTATAEKIKAAVELRTCGNCANWTRKNPDDLTAPEGRCGLAANPGHWPLGYWPNTLQRDRCARGFKKTAE